MNDEPIEPRKREIPINPASIANLIGELSDDERRVRITVELTRDDTRPDLDLHLNDATGIEISRSTILEVFGPSMVFTMHIRKTEPKFPLTLTCRLNYLDDTIQSEKEIIIEKA
jgi:hypothetical protein